MENPKIPKWPRVPEGQKLVFRKKILLFSVFLIISVFIWLLNALSKNYSAGIEFPLVYTELPEGKVFVGKPPDHLDLSVNAAGYSLLSYKVFRRPEPIEFKLSSFTMNRRGQSGDEAYILTRYVRDQVALQLPSELQLLDIQPDTLRFFFGSRIRKELPVKADIRFELDRQFTTVDGIRTSPGSVMVSGPDRILDTMRYVRTETLDLGLISRNFKEKVALKKSAELEYELQKVDCAIELERFTQVDFQVALQITNLPDTLTIQTFPSRIKITATVGLSKFEKMENHLFRAEADYLSADREKGILEVRLMNIPEDLIGYEYSPKSVEFLTSLR